MRTRQAIPLALAVGLALAACSGPGAPAKPATQSAGGGQTSAAAQKPPGAYTPNGEADGSSGTVSTQHLDTMKFNPNTFTKVKVGSKLTVQMRNGGATIHSILAPSMGVTAKADIASGQSSSVTFNVPAQPGTYPFWCPEPGHAEAGMTGQVVVVQ